MRPSPRHRPPEGPLVLLILDGVGVGTGDAFDAVAQARTPQLDALRGKALVRTLRAHGTWVGLPSDKDMGNSEVGHNALGAGRVFDQGAKLVDQAIAGGAIWQGPWRELIEPLLDSGGTLHLIGLLSDGNVHSHEKQLFALIRRAAEEGVSRVRVHVLLDGRDVPETSALTYLDRLEALLAEIGGRPDRDYCIASGGGRMVTTMDRYEADWEIVARGYRAHVHGEGRGFGSARQAVETYRSEQPGLVDQYLPPFVVVDGAGRPVGRIVDGDSVIFFNFRGDRAIEISRAFEEGDGFCAFDRGCRPDVRYAGMMLYDGDLGIPRRYLVAPPRITRTISEYLAHTDLRQFACAETQKFGHVTYFWNGNRSGKFSVETEDYLEIPSDQVPFDQRPWMKSAETADAVIEQLATGRHRFLRANFAAGDMVGHTGDLEAAILAVQAVDLQIGRILPELRRVRGTLVITADHGNSDDMVERGADGRPKLDADGRPRPRTSHSLNPVEFMVQDYSGRPLALRADLPEAGLSHVAATLLELLGFEPPPGYDASLLGEGQ
ncbi:MAG: 2,3-bisphosphoglycerate-independent phosphoglycerate mutase [Acidobacteriota bacterium]|nr:2,3-bisphosphoglycerate-independent phosphoglycerate mutase [Acidobacteriota bacterium]MDQ7088893.1 2,3-bisphosphoglycerate-independent phosphoglycerate mutase [Acidobacteriota bacterium]